MLHDLSLWFALFILWLLLSGYLGIPLLLVCGLLSCTLVVLVVRRTQTIDSEKLGLSEYLNPRLPSYLFWLLLEIVKSNIDVAKRILNPDLPISPTLISLKPSQDSELGQVIYANSITLTPGTVTTYLSDGRLEVHALTEAGARSLAEGEMDRRVTTVAEGGR